MNTGSMMLSGGNAYAALLVAVMSLTTILLRALPFLVFRDEKDTPAMVRYLGKVLPHAIVGMLVIYCLKDVNPTAAPFGLPEFLTGACVILLQAWKRNALVSILLGTFVYICVMCFM